MKNVTSLFRFRNPLIVPETANTMTATGVPPQSVISAKADSSSLSALLSQETMLVDVLWSDFMILGINAGKTDVTKVRTY